MLGGGGGHLKVKTGFEPQPAIELRVLGIGYLGIEAQASSFQWLHHEKFASSTDMGSCKLGGHNTGLLVLLQILEEKVYQYCFQYFPVLLHINNTGTILEDTGN